MEAGKRAECGGARTESGMNGGGRRPQSRGSRTRTFHMGTLLTQESFQSHALQSYEPWSRGVCPWHPVPVLVPSPGASECVMVPLGQRLAPPLLPCFLSELLSSSRFLCCLPRGAGKPEPPASLGAASSSPHGIVITGLCDVTHPCWEEKVLVPACASCPVAPGTCTWPRGQPPARGLCACVTPLGWGNGSRSPSAFRTEVIIQSLYRRVAYFPISMELTFLPLFLALF